MNYSTADYLNQLETDRQGMVTNLTTKGITGLTGDETFTELVPEVLNIPSGGDPSEYFETEPTTMTVNNWAQQNFLKKVATLTIPNSVTSLTGLFRGYTLTKMPKVICGNQVTSMYGMYDFMGGDYQATNNTYVTEIDVSGLNTSNVQSMERMFKGMASITSLDLSNFDTTRLNTVSGAVGGRAMEMFINCKSLTTLNLSNFHITCGYNNDCSSMFSGCENLQTLILNNTSITAGNPVGANNEIIKYMFKNCKKLTSIDLSFIYINSHSNSLAGLFDSCTSLTTVIFGDNIKNNNFTDMTNLFNKCSSLAHVDARNISFTNVSAKTNMMTNVPTNCEIIVADQTQKDWFATNFSSYTNVKTVAEYEAE